MTDPMRRPTTVQALQAAVRRESADRLRATVLLLLLLGAASLGLAAGYLVGLRNISAAQVEAAGTWFGAFMGLGTLLVAARVFLGDRLYQQYQVEAAKQADLDRANAQARAAQQQADLVRTSIQYNSGSGTGVMGRVLVSDLRVIVDNHSRQPVSEIQFRHVDHAPEWTLWSGLVLPAGVGGAQRVFQPVTPFATADDHSELIAGSEFMYQHGGTTWLRKGNGPPTPVAPTPAGS